MSKENTVEENAAVDVATNEDDKTPVTSRKYKITVCVIAVLLAIAFLVKDYVIFREMMDGSAGDEVGISSFIKWWFDERKSYMIIGVIIMLIPYEIIYNIDHNIFGSIYKDSDKNRKWTTIGYLFIMLILPVWIILSVHVKYQMAVILCNAAMGFVVCLNLKQYFSTALGWLVYVTIYNTGSFGSIFYCIYFRADAVLDSVDPRSWIHMGYVDAYLIMIYLSSAIAFVVYALLVDKDDRKLFTILWELVVAVGIPVFIFYKTVKTAVASVDYNLFDLIGFVGVSETGIQAFKNPYLLAMYVSFLVIVVLMVYALKKVSEYSRRRMMVLIWTAMFMFLMLMIDVISETGIGAGYSSLFTIFDMVNVIVLFIAIRALIIPVKSCPDMECNFSSEEERIQELEFKNKIMMTYIDGIQDEVDTLINYMKILEVTQNKDRAHVSYLIESDSEAAKSILEYRDEMNKVIASVQERGGPVNYKELIDKMNEFKDAVENKIDDAYRQKFKEMGYDDDEIDAAMSSGEDNRHQDNMDNFSNEKIYDEKEIRSNYRHLTQLLISRHLTITTMESATSGQIASLVTDTEGSSAVLKGAFVTYCNEAKIMQGVPAEIIDRYTVYSKETAGSMAQTCRNAYNANIGIGVTGTMGNVDPANPNASVQGQVYFAIDIDGDVQTYYIELPPQPTRLAYKLAVAEEIYEELVKRLE